MSDIPDYMRFSSRELNVGREGDEGARAERAELRRQHVQCPSCQSGHCDACSGWEDWPCPTIRAVEQLERLEKALEHIADLYERTALVPYLSRQMGEAAQMALGRIPR